MTIPKPTIRIEDIMSSSKFTVEYSLSYNDKVNEPVVLRFFYDEEKARKAVELVRAEGFACELIEDKFNETSFDKFGMRRRFKIVVELADYNKVAQVLAKKLRRGRIG